MKERLKKLFNKNTVVRLVYGLILLMVTVGFGVLGGWYWFGFVLVLSIIGLWEFYRVFGIEWNLLGIIGYATGLVYWVILATDRLEFLFPTLILGFMAIMVSYVLHFKRSETENAITAYFGLIYVTVLMSYLYRIRVEKDGEYLVWLVFLSSWGSDIFAYIFGSLLGKHKMAPNLSPKKSWEGAVGGVIGATGLGALYGLVLAQHFSNIGQPVFACALISGVAAVVSVFGDLLASAFKRSRDVKDYSHLIPGHGGILDRFDSTIFIAPAIFYLAQLFVRGYIK